MYVALNKNNTEVTAFEAKRGEQFYCPVCKCPVTLKKGSVKTPHFSHFKMIHCTRFLYKKESMAHLKAKHDLYLSLATNYSVNMEYYLKEIEQIPDILVNDTVALEIQFSPIAPSLIESRSNGYFSLYKRVIWILNEKNFNFSSPTHFDLATMQNNTIFTYDIHSEIIYQYIAITFKGENKFQWHKESVPITFLIENQKVNVLTPTYRLSQKEINYYIHNAKQQKSVHNITLSMMYQNGYLKDTLPKYITTVLCDEVYILNPPMEWKLYVEHMLLSQTFDFNKFKNYIVMRVGAHQEKKEQVCKNLIEGFIQLYYAH